MVSGRNQEFDRELFPAWRIKTSELLLLRTAFGCEEKADILGLHTNARQRQKGDSWSASEIEILSKYYPGISAKVMASLPGRTENACVSMAQKVGAARAG